MVTPLKRLASAETKFKDKEITMLEDIDAIVGLALQVSESARDLQNPVELLTDEKEKYIERMLTMPSDLARIRRDLDRMYTSIRSKKEVLGWINRTPMSQIRQEVADATS